MALGRVEGRLGRPVAPRAVLLDCLGTLLALEPPAPLLVESLRREYGVELDETDAERAFAAEIAYYRAHHLEGRDEEALAGLRGRCAEVLHGALPVQIHAALSVDEILPAMLASLRFGVYPEAPGALASLHARGLALVVVSNWDVSLPSVLAEAGLAPLLDGVVTSAECGSAKPAAGIFRAALARAGVGAAEALHVGDSVDEDVRGALAVGVRAMLLRRQGEVLLRRQGAARAADVGAGSGARTGAGAETGVGPPRRAPELPAGAPVIESLAELPALI